MSRLSRLQEFYDRYGFLGYTANNWDTDMDGIPNRADVDDGDGLDCSGCDWAAYRYAWAPDPVPFQLSSTTGYAIMAEHLNLWVPLNADTMQWGDILLHSSNGNVFNSDGPVGHTEVFGGKTPNRPGYIRCYGSSGGGKGVGYVDRPISFWQKALRIPGLGASAPSTPVITPADWEALRQYLEAMDMEHGQAVDAVFAAGGRLITLERWGSLACSNGAKFKVTGYWPGQDVARKIVLSPECMTNKDTFLTGYVMDLDGAFHPFTELNKYTQKETLLAPLPPAPVGMPWWKNGKIVQFNEA